MKIDYSQIDNFPQSYHNEVNEDDKRLAHPGYRLTECNRCGKAFVQGKLESYTLCVKCGVHEE